jgi:hypothetical protein
MEEQSLQHTWETESHNEGPYVKYLLSSFMFTAAESALTFSLGLSREQKTGTEQTEIMEQPMARDRINYMGCTNRALICSLSIFSF